MSKKAFLMPFVAAITLLATTTSSNAQPLAPTAEELKAQIRQIAIANLDRQDTDGSVYVQLAPLVFQLSVYNPPRSRRAQLRALSGAWKQIYSDDFNGGQLDLDQIFQVVTRRGVFFNFGSRVGAPGRFSALKGEYRPVGDQLAIEFVEFGAVPFAVSRFTNLEALADSIDFGFVRLQSFPPAVPTPVGTQGVLSNLYVDRDFRVDIGFNAVDGKLDLFILDRVDFPERFLGN